MQSGADCGSFDPEFFMALALAFPTFTAGMVLSMSLIMAIGPQNAHVLRVGLQRQHLWLTVAVCAVADVVLIGLGVLGLAQLGGLSDKLHGALIGAGMLFLAVYGWQAFQRFLHPGALAIAGSAPAPAAEAEPVSRRQAVLAALAFSWLNPHAWIDTAVLIGTASLAYGQGSKVFGLGAAAGSLVWFVVLGTAAFWLGRRLNSLKVWRALDGLVALMMWATALWLLLSLF
jgi:L-lysine exporter family protein LysE/ArgO